MSKGHFTAELPRDAHVMQALRRELQRNSRQITQTFWQEFEQIRNEQRNQLAQERENRQRISTLMRDANLETQQQAEALSRSISAHGINPSAPSPCMRREPPAIMFKAEEASQELMNPPVDQNQKSPVQLKDIGEQPRQQTLPSKSTSLQTSLISSQLPRAPPTSRATLISRTPPKTSPNISKLQLAHKPTK